MKPSLPSFSIGRQHDVDGFYLGFLPGAGHHGYV